MLLELFDLLALLFDLLLLLLDLALRLLVLRGLVLHLVADHKATSSTEAAANRRARCRMAYGCADDRASACTQQSAHTGTLLPFGQGLPGTSGDQKQGRQCKCHGRNLTAAHKKYLPRLATRLFGFLLLLHLLDLLALLLDFLLLGLELGLRLLLTDFLVLHLVADECAADSANSAADRGADSRSTNGSTNYRACRGSYATTDERSFFAGAERLPRASRQRDEHHRRQQTIKCQFGSFPHPIPPFSRSRFYARDKTPYS
ncbi:MAG TPA: hypothetical protein VEF07_10600 [Candidatus Binataceae bacterium]|nr:hypothetical protein [Candidatus Binataceae bacterium]